MALNAHQFILTSALRNADLATYLERVDKVVREPNPSYRRIYLDTFDWRLHEAGQQLSLVSHGVERQLNWRSANGDERIIALAEQDAYRFHWELPFGKLRELLAPVIEMRALLPQVTLATRPYTLAICDRNHKRRCTVTLERHHLVSGDTQTKLLPRLRVLPIRGYENTFKRVKAALHDIQGLQVAEVSPQQEAYHHAQLTPGDYSTKINVRLTPEMRTDAALRTILLRLLDNLERNQEGVRTNTDSEFLHDFRVAVRRSRVALDRVTGVIPQTTRNRYRKEFAWLGMLTSPARDMDVYLLEIDHYRAMLPSKYQNALEPLRQFLHQRQEQAYTRLVKQMATLRYQRLCTAWRNYLQRPLPKRSRLPHALTPVKEVADGEIWKSYRRVYRDGKRITPASPPADLHSLRKRCKRLRYLMEFFRSLYPKRTMQNSIRALKELQERLGEYQDLEVQAATLDHLKSEMDEATHPPHRTLEALDLLVKKLRKRQHQVRREFAGHFGAFIRQQNQALFRELFAPSKRA